ncbi:unnamed protein product [Anisakis simplex]|uniref:CPG4 domain-containing protein n=1 Tax=Anisakis simplex TaxID=6269 RepID=A0A158PNY0_ANISI|nr:unnamed protein product [Anisakis simplex]
MSLKLQKIKVMAYAYEQLIKCAAACNDANPDELTRRIVLKFRLVSECIQSQDAETVNQCATECRHPADATVQFDSSPSATVNPFAFFDSITPVCRCSSLECIVKCTISESNKKCAGSGDIFRDIALKQIIVASERLRNDLDNSSSPVAGQLAKIYLEALPDECMYIVDPAKYNAGDDDTVKVTIIDDGSISEQISTHFDTISTTTQGFSGDSSQERDATSTIATFAFEPVNEPEIPIGPPSFVAQIPNLSNVEHIPEIDDPSEAESSSSLIPEINEQPLNDNTTAHRSTSSETTQSSLLNDATSSISSEHATENDPAEEVHLEKIETSTNEAERTIMVVNDDESEIAHNEVREENHEAQQQKQHHVRVLLLILFRKINW